MIAELGGGDGIKIPCYRLPKRQDNHDKIRRDSNKESLKYEEGAEYDALETSL